MPYNPRQGGGSQEPEPKPFAKLVLPKGWSRRITPRDKPHDRFAQKSYTGELRCLLRALTLLHIGSGIYDMEGDNPVRGLITEDGRPIIPGTSLKGAIRSIAEAISDSCARIIRKDIEFNLAAKEAAPCREVRSRHRTSRGDRGGETKLCVCCSIFGALGYQGRVSFTDARLSEEGNARKITAIHQIQSAYPPRDSSQFYRDAQRRINGRKFYYHGEPVASQRGEPYQVISEDSEFEFSVLFESLTAQELCLILVAMGALDDIVIKIGGAKQAMLGSAEISLIQLDLQNTKDSFKDISGGQTVMTEGIIDYLLEEVGQANQLVHEDALDSLMNIWQWPSDRKAPTGMY